MRALFTVQPSPGHFFPLVPVAAALEHAGHEVAFASAPSFRAEVEPYGFEYFDAGLDWLASDQSTWTAFPPMPPPGPAFGAFVVTLFADLTTGPMARDLLAVARGWHPDLIVREGMEYGGCLAAERLGLPHASVAGNAYAAVDSPEVTYFPGNRRLVAEPLSRHRAHLGLEPDAEMEMPFRHLHLCFMPPCWSGDAPAPPNTRYFRHTSHVAPGDPRVAWSGGESDRPRVLASLGTVFNKTPGVLEAIIEALSGEPVDALVAIGSDRDPEDFGAVPAHVRLEPHVPQTALLADCDAFITHGGFNSVKEALSAGTPMVVVPITADQPYSASRCAALGVGCLVGPQERSAAPVRRALRAVLDDSAYREAAASIRAEMEALPGPEAMVEVLETLAQERAPV